MGREAVSAAWSLGDPTVEEITPGAALPIVALGQIELAYTNSVQ